MTDTLDSPAPEMESKFTRPSRSLPINLEIKERLREAGFENPPPTVLSKLGQISTERKARELDAALQAAEAVGRVVIRPWADLVSRPSVPWLVDGVLQEVGVGQLIGPPARHKSNLAIDLGMSVASSLDDWMGFPIRRHGRVLYVALEGASGLAGRALAWQSGHS